MKFAMSADDVLLRADRLPRVCLGDATPGTATKCSHIQTHKHKSQHPTKGEKTNFWQMQVGTATHIPRVQGLSDSAQMKKTASLPVDDLSTGVCVRIIIFMWAFVHLQMNCIRSKQCIWVEVGDSYQQYLVYFWKRLTCNFYKLFITVAIPKLLS